MHAPAFLTDPKTAFMALIFAAVFVAAQTVWGLVRRGAAKRVVNRRLAVAEQTGSLGELVLELRKQRGLTEEGQGRGNFLADLIVRSGLKFEPRKWALYVAAIALAAGGLTMELSHKPLLFIPAGLAAGIVVPYVYLKFVAGRRAKMLGQQLPNALEIVVRSLEAGHPIPTAISLVGREMPDPVGSEFGMAGDEIAYGSTLEQAVARIADRCRHPDVDLFAASIRLQEKAGGNLTGLLKMLAKTVRERHKMRLKIKAASSEARMSAIILTCAPIVCFIFINVAQPHYYNDVIGKRFVQIGLGILGALLLTGNYVMRRMTDMRI